MLAPSHISSLRHNSRITIPLLHPQSPSPLILALRPLHSEQFTFLRVHRTQDQHAGHASTSRHVRKTTLSQLCFRFISDCFSILFSVRNPFRLILYVLLPFELAFRLVLSVSCMFLVFLSYLMYLLFLFHVFMRRRIRWLSKRFFKCRLTSTCALAYPLHYVVFGA